MISVAVLKKVRVFLLAAAAVIVLIVGMFSYAPPGTKNLLGMHWLAWLATAVASGVGTLLIARSEKRTEEWLLIFSIAAVLVDELAVLAILWGMRPSGSELKGSAAEAIIDVTAVLVMFAPFCAAAVVVLALLSRGAKPRQML